MGFIRIQYIMQHINLKIIIFYIKTKRYKDFFLIIYKFHTDVLIIIHK